VLSFPAIERIWADAQIIGDLSGGFVAFQTQLESIDFELPVKTEAFPSFPSGQGIKYTINAGF
jgi:hypothetical protein